MPYKYTAVLIEPREHKAMSFVLTNFFTNLSDEWGFVIFHGNKNKTFIETLLSNELQDYKHRIVRLIQLDIDNLTIAQFNAICTDPNFYRCIDTETILLFHLDSMIIKEHKNILEQFLMYDYVGAPWRDGCVGNGGLSLRKRSKMIEICEKIGPIPRLNEDIYFCYQNEVELHRPTFQEAKRFSVETVFYETCFGIHAPWKHLTSYEIAYFIQRYPDILTLMSLQ